MIDLQKPTLRHDLDTEIDRLESLLADLQRLRHGGYPSHGELSVAPLLVNPELVMIAAPSFAGLVVGHPKHGTKGVRTSVIEVLGPGWFRSSNRLYRIEVIEGLVQ